MHVQKNIFESLIATLMDIGKSKDGLKARKDMVQLNMMPQLHLVLEANGKYPLPRGVLQPNTRREESYMHFPEGDQIPDWVFSKCEEASVDEGLINNTARLTIAM